MLSILVVVSLVILPFVTAQSTNDTALQIKAIEAHFSASGIVPSLLTSFHPNALLAINYAGKQQNMLSARFNEVFYQKSGM
jgi:hypothetical protein